MFTNLIRPGKRGFKYINGLWQASGGSDIVMAPDARPVFNHAWVDDGGVYRVYSLVGGTNDVATTPCLRDMPSEPSIPADVDVTAFNYNAGDGGDTCIHTIVESDDGTVTFGGSSVDLHIDGLNTGYSAARFRFDSMANTPLAGDFIFTASVANLDVPYFDSGMGSPSNTYCNFNVGVTIGGDPYSITVRTFLALGGGDAAGHYNGYGYRNGNTGTHTKVGSTRPTSGDFTLERSGTDLILKLDTTTLVTFSGVSTAAPTAVYINLDARVQPAQTEATADITAVTFA